MTKCRLGDAEAAALARSQGLGALELLDVRLNAQSSARADAALTSPSTTMAPGNHAMDTSPSNLVALASPWSRVHYGRRREEVGRLVPSQESIRHARTALRAALAELTVSASPSTDEVDAQQLQYWSLVSQHLADALPTFAAALAPTARDAIESRGLHGDGSAEGLVRWFRHWAVADLAEDVAQWLSSTLPRDGRREDWDDVLALVETNLASVPEPVALALVALAGRLAGGDAVLERTTLAPSLSRAVRSAIAFELSHT